MGNKDIEYNGDGLKFVRGYSSELIEIVFPNKSRYPVLDTELFEQLIKLPIVKKRKPGMGRDKGSTFELDVADKLSIWWYRAKKVLRRTPMSGGWSKTAAAGDLISEFPNSWPFGIECKHNKSWSWNDLFNPSLGEIGSFWNQCVTECESGKIPVLVFRGNYGKTYVMVRTTDFNISESKLDGPIVKRKGVKEIESSIFQFDLMLKLDPLELIKEGLLYNLTDSEVLKKDRLCAVDKGFKPC